MSLNPAHLSLPEHWVLRQHTWEKVWFSSQAIDQVAAMTRGEYTVLNLFVKVVCKKKKQHGLHFESNQFCKSLRLASQSQFALPVDINATLSFIWLNYVFSIMAFWTKAEVCQKGFSMLRNSLVAEAVIFVIYKLGCVYLNSVRKRSLALSKSKLETIIHLLVCWFC